jgi:hypothetical protein
MECGSEVRMGVECEGEEKEGAASTPPTSTLVRPHSLAQSSRLTFSSLPSLTKTTRSVLLRL